MKRSGCAPHHASRCQSLYARIAASASSSSSGHIVSRWPTKPGRNDGKHSDAHTPSMSMSATRAFTSHAPRRISSKRVGSKPYSLDGRPTTALNPTLGSCWPCHTHASPPSSVGDDARLVVGELLREPAGERVGRLDDVVVDRDDRVRALARLGLGQPRDLLAPALAAAERLAAREVVERHVRSRRAPPARRASSMRTAPSQYALRRVLVQQRPCSARALLGRASRPACARPRGCRR